MEWIAIGLVALVAIEHLYFLYLEMFLWTKPAGLKTFGMSLEKARESKTLAANQGLYNGFLAVGLFWGLVHPNNLVGFQIQIYFLVCVLVAGVYGGYKVNKSLLIFQGLPALIALVAVFLFDQ
ncbi:DUF1304 domain-containing protein [Teredinibacter waterburyi]|jgi:Predicted membrane protein|uniref:DUF1304 domain-containing protein n=1 Tax=Teredinibacter waterburyi TaxID=1500538 RepID=UPI00165F1AE6|nr:DUF1304 domain-containing protein [Teredinibacter waterburyi]